MSIKQRLLLSNILVIALPFIAFFILEVLLGYLFFFQGDRTINEENMGTFTTIRLISFAAVVIIINSVLILVLSRTIIKPLNKLRMAVKEIGRGNLGYTVDTEGKDELSELARDFDEMRLKLKASKELNDAYEEEKRTMIAGIGHDLKTPVTSIQGYVNGLLDGVASTEEKQEKYLKTISNKTKELDQLINELSLFSSLNAEESPLEKEYVELGHFLSHFIDESRLEFENENIELSYNDKAEDKVVIEADRMKLSRVFMNILSNSVKYRDKAEHTIDIELSMSGQYAVIDIKDNGRGISEAAIERISEPFYREETSRNKNTGGSGLGLAIVKDIVAGHGGNMDIRSEQGRWTTVTVKLPLSRGV